MEQLLLLAGISLVAVAFSALLQRTAKEYTVLLSLAVVALAVGTAVQAAQPVLDLIAGLLQWGELDAAWVRILLKTLGICLLCQMTATLCRDAGENSLAFGLETLCRVTVLVQALPLLQQVAELALQLLRE